MLKIPEGLIGILIGQHLEGEEGWIWFLREFFEILGDSWGL